jgi:hypothetical protein
MASGIVAHLGGYVKGVSAPTVSANLGGYVFSKVIPGNELVALLGGYVKSLQGQSIRADLGGFCLSLPITPVGPAFLGGFASGLFQTEAFLGGYTFGRHGYSEYVSTRARTLAVAVSEDVVDQSLSMDAQIVFKQIFANEFNAKLDNIATFQNDIHGKAEVLKFKVPPTTSINSIDYVTVPVFDNGIRQVTVTASGALGDGDEWTNVQIDFGDPFDPLGGFKPFQSISGFSGPPPWTASHDYNMSGIYVITIRGQDNLGMVGMNCSGLNLASGLAPGLYFPLIDISGIPRFGEVPPSLQVSFTIQSSGINAPPYTNKQNAQSQIQSPTDDRIQWNFGNREKSVRSAPITYYQSPGLFATVLRYLYTNPSGAAGIDGFGINGKFMVSDTLLIGYGR